VFREPCRVVRGARRGHPGGARLRVQGAGGASPQAAARENATTLGKAIFAEIAVPATICCLAYSALYWIYPADRRRARMALQEAPGDQKNYGCEASGPADDGFKQPLLSGTVTE